MDVIQDGIGFQDTWNRASACDKRGVMEYISPNYLKGGVGVIYVKNIGDLRLQIKYNFVYILMLTT